MIDLDPIPFETKRKRTRAFVWVDEGEMFVLYRVNDQSATPVMKIPATSLPQPDAEASGGAA